MKLVFAVLMMVLLASGASAFPLYGGNNQVSATVFGIVRDGNTMVAWHFDVKLTNNGNHPLGYDGFYMVDQFGWRYKAGATYNSTVGSDKIMPGESLRFEVVAYPVYA